MAEKTDTLAEDEHKAATEATVEAVVEEPAPKTDGDPAATEETEPVATEVEDATESPAPASKAERLEAKAARLRAREEERRQAREAKAAEGGAKGPRYSTMLVALSSVAVLLVAGLGVTLVLLVQQHHDTDRARQQAVAAQRQAGSLPSSALDAARRYAVDIASYDYQSLDKGFAKVMTDLTPSYQKTYQSDVTGLRAAIVKYKAKAVASVQAVGISTVTPTSVTALVFLDQTVTSSRSTAATVNRNRVEMQLKLVNGTWLIDGMLLV